MKNLKIWRYYTINAFQQALAHRGMVLVFLFGKSLRIGLFLIFLFFLFQDAVSLAGFTREQIIFFYLSFNLIDTLGQLLFREVYRFRPLIVSGGLDFILLKPFHPLIRVLLGGADVIDLLMLSVLLVSTVWYGVVHITGNPLSWALFTLLVINGLLIAAAFHIFVLGIGIMTVSVDHLVLIYRDLTSLLRIPVDLYIEPVRTLLTFVIPIGIMITFPPKVLMGLLSGQAILFSLLLASFSLFASLRFWNYSLRHYQSTGS